MQNTGSPDHVCDELVYRELFRSLSKSLRDFLFYKSGNLETANDIVQDAFFKLWEKCKDVPYEKAKSFVFTTGHNLFINSVKRDKVRLNYKSNVANAKVEKEDPAYQMEMKEYKDRLDQAIADLPEGQREVFLLNRINKMTYAEIAESLGVSQKAIEKRMSKALMKLRDVLHPKK